MSQNADNGGARPQTQIAAVFASAGIANMCAAFITNPINVVKVRMQLNGALAAKQDPHYGGFRRTLLRVTSEEGIVALWKGTVPALLREASYSSIRMGAYEPMKEALGGHDPASTPLWVKVTAGAISGAVGSCIANPTDVVMIRMQAKAPAVSTPRGASVLAEKVLGQQYRGTWHAFSTIAREEGMRGLYRGVGPTMQRAALLTAAQVPSYDHTKHLLLNSGVMMEGIPIHLVASMAAGFTTALTIAPLDLVKTRIMQQAVKADGSGEGLLYSSALDCLTKTWRAEGFPALYKGFIPVWLRIGPHTIITFFVFEELRHMLGIRPV